MSCQLEQVQLGSVSFSATFLELFFYFSGAFSPIYSVVMDSPEFNFDD